MSGGRFLPLAQAPFRRNTVPVHTKGGERGAPRRIPPHAPPRERIDAPRPTHAPRTIINTRNPAEKSMCIPAMGERHA